MPSIDATEYLNNLLLAAPQIGTQRSEQYEETVCHWMPGGDEPGEKYCETKIHTKSITTYSPATVVNSRVLKVQAIEIYAAVPTAIPESAVVTRKTIRNFADAQIVSSVNLSVSGTESWTVTKTSGVSTTSGASVTLSGTAAAIGSGSVNINFSQTISTSVSTTEGNTRAVGRSTNDTVSIGPNKSIQFELLAYQSTADLPFKAIVIIDGDLQINSSGVSLASHLVSEAARTLAVEGTIHVSGLSEAFLTVIELPQQMVSLDSSVASIAIDENYIIRGEISERMKTHFLRLSKVTREGNIIAPQRLSKLLQPSTQDNDGPELKPADGTSYEVLYTENVYRPSPQCGFNDLGVMKGGIFKVEARQYSTHVNGKLVASWSQRSEEIFVSCWEP
jgi:ubiquinone biosynthesis protein UbiJ